MHRWATAQKVFWIIMIAWTIMLFAIALHTKDNENFIYYYLPLMSISPLIGIAIRHWHEYAYRKKIKDLNPR